MPLTPLEILVDSFAGAFLPKFAWQQADSFFRLPKGNPNFFSPLYGAIEFPSFLAWFKTSLEAIKKKNKSRLRDPTFF